MKLKIKSKIELDDYIKFNFYCQKKMLISIVLFSLIIFLFIIYKGGGSVPGKEFLVIIIFLTYVFSLTNNMKKKFKKIFISDKLLQEECEYIFGKTSFIEKTLRGEVTIKYSDVVKVVENKNAIYIFISEIRCYIIPKRYITQEEQKKIIEMIDLGMNVKKA